MRKKRHTFALLLAVLLWAATLLSGCEMSGLSAETLMRPPAAAGDGAAIQLAMEEALGSQITLRYPRRGENRSAMVRADLDGDGQQEAVAFYRAATETEGAHMIVLDTDEDGHWKAVGEAESTGGEIERVMFGDLNGDGNMEIIAGWSLYSDSIRIITAHAYSGTELSTLQVLYSDDISEITSTASYTTMAVGDIDSDGRDDIVAVLLNVSAGTALATVYSEVMSFGGGRQVLARDSAELDGSTVTYVNSEFGRLASGLCGFVVDGYRADGSYSTEVVCWDRESSTLCPLLNGENGQAILTRSQAVYSGDIDNNGCIELPCVQLLPGWENNDPSALFLTEWYSFRNDGGLVSKSTGIVRAEDGYYFAFDNNWIGRLTAQRDAEKKTVYFYMPGSFESFGSEVMRLKVFTIDEWEEEETWSPMDILEVDGGPRYMELATTDYYVYGVLIAAEGALDGLTYNEIADNFILLQ